MAVGRIENVIGQYLLTYADIPFCLDAGRSFSQGFSDSHEVEAGYQLPPHDQRNYPDLIDELNKRIPFSWLNEFDQPPSFPGKNLSAISHWANSKDIPQVNIGEWYYPPTATHWSVFRGIAGSTQVKDMLAASVVKAVSSSTTDRWKPNDLIMRAIPVGPVGSDSGLYTVKTKMWMLPPRPLAEHGREFDGLFLVTLVDERYYWQFADSGWIGIDQFTTWDDLISEISASLNITLTYTTIKSAYSRPEPDSQLWSQFENPAVMLDALAYNLGRTVVRKLDGTYRLYHSEDSRIQVYHNRSSTIRGFPVISGTITDQRLVARCAGGDIFSPNPLNLTGDRQPATNSVLTSYVKVVFPSYIYTNDPVPHFVNRRYQPQRPSTWYEDSYGQEWAHSVSITSGNLESGAYGVSGLFHTIHSTAKALYSGENQVFGDPVNASGLIDLARQIAEDYWGDQVGAALDEVYPGIVNWDTEGIHDIVWTYSARSRGAYTRVMRTAWNQMVRHMQHATPALSGWTNTMVGVGGHSVAQSIIDTPVLSGQFVTKTLKTALTRGGEIALLSDVAFLPTQNRWKGTIFTSGSFTSGPMSGNGIVIDREDLLFEGTSGGTASGIPGSEGVPVKILYREIDGTIQQTHAAGKFVQWIEPNRTHGVNLTTFGKMMPVHPAEWTSGGIQGIEVVPQTQTVYSFDDSGLKVGNTTYYSGRVYVPDHPGDQWVAKEYIWIEERNRQPVYSGKFWDGQFAGYSPSVSSGNLSGFIGIAPVYLVNAHIYSSGVVSSEGTGVQLIAVSFGRFGKFYMSHTLKNWNFSDPNRPSAVLDKRVLLLDGGDVQVGGSTRP